MSDFQKNCFITFFSNKICKNWKVLTGAVIPAGQEFSTGTGPDRAGPAVYRYRFHLWLRCRILKLIEKRRKKFSRVFADSRALGNEI